MKLPSRLYPHPVNPVNTDHPRINGITGMGGKPVSTKSRTRPRQLILPLWGLSVPSPNKRDKRDVGKAEAA